MTQARTPAEKLGDLLTLRAKVEAEIKATLRTINNQPPQRRSRLIVPECGTESAYQRHAHLGEDTDEECKAAHSLHNRVQWARRHYGETAC